jgi:MoxR-like ATPase
MPSPTHPLPSPFPAAVELPALGHYEAHEHVFEDRSVWAIRAALAARRPLLVCGEPGTGKSQLARAAAVALNRPLVSFVVTSRTEPQDLLWRYDAVARLAEAQVLALTLGRPQPAGTSDGQAPELAPLTPLKFVSPGPLWWVFDWEDATRQREDASVTSPLLASPAEWASDQGVVALIDEIDKADLDLPNALLECLGNGEFHLPYRAESVRCGSHSQPPLVIITSNRERQLPPAFVRRCLVLELALPKSRDDLITWLGERGKAHFGKECPAPILAEVAVGIADRRGSEDTVHEDMVRPGLAEYLDLLRALATHAPGDLKRQREVLKEIADFVYDKQPAFEL